MSGESRARATGLVAFATEYGSPDLRLEWYLVVLPAVVANDLESFWSLATFGRFSRATLGAALGGHHVALVKDLLFFFGEKEGLFALNARGFDVRHNFSPYSANLRVIAAHSNTKRDMQVTVIHVSIGQRDFWRFRQASPGYNRLRDTIPLVPRTHRPPTALPSPSST